jgi:hypothetical protein
LFLDVVFIRLHFISQRPQTALPPPPRDQAAIKAGRSLGFVGFVAQCPLKQITDLNLHRTIVIKTNSFNFKGENICLIILLIPSPKECRLTVDLNEKPQ